MACARLTLHANLLCNRIDGLNYALFPLCLPLCAEANAQRGSDVGLLILSMQMCDTDSQLD